MKTNVRNKISFGLFVASFFMGQQSLADTVISDDIIGQDNACIGFDCVNGESFGFDTLRLKENNTRIRFFDTSTSAAFPSNDWELTANDSSNGGANRFSILDINTDRNLFTVEAGAPEDALFLDSSGRAGFGTSTPLVELHTFSGDSPALRLEQDGSSGLSSYAWDVSGNEVGFFVRDVTNGETLPMRIRSGAPESSLDVSASGFVGFSNSSPDALIHVNDSSTGTVTDFDDVLGLRVENTSATEAERSMLALANNGSTGLLLQDSSAGGAEWRLVNTDSGFVTVYNDTTQLTVDNSGNVSAIGEICGDSDGVNECIGSVPSSRAIKSVIENIDTASILNAVAALSISRWRYNAHPSDVHHIGPMAEDFHEAFGLNGSVSDRIANVDLTGVALASIQELNKKLQDKDDEIATLKREIEEIKALLLAR